MRITKAVLQDNTIKLRCECMDDPDAVPQADVVFGLGSSFTLDDGEIPRDANGDPVPSDAAVSRETKIQRAILEFSRLHQHLPEPPEVVLPAQGADTTALVHHGETN